MARLKRSERQFPVLARSGVAQHDGSSVLNRGLLRGLQVLGAFRDHDQYLGNVELSERTALPRSTVSRICETLTGAGYMTYSPTLGHYALGPSVVTLSRSMLDNMGNRFRASPVLQRLADALHLPVSLGMRDGLTIIYVETARKAGSRPARYDLGTRIPMLTSAIGRAYLAMRNDAEVKELLAATRSTAAEADWPKLTTAVQQARQDIEARGYCHASETWRTDVVGVAVPIFLADGTVLVMNAGGTVREVTEARIHNEIGPMLMAAAAEVALRASGSDIAQMDEDQIEE